MNTADLLALLRITFDDTVPPYLVSDEVCLQALDKAQYDFAAETLCIFDGQTPVAVNQDEAYVNLPEGTVWVKAALYDSTLLTVVTQHELDYGYFSFEGIENLKPLTNWRTQTGEPKFLVTDLGASTCRLVPFPDVAGTLGIERYRLPIDLSLVQDPEIAVQFHKDLITGALITLYQIQDVDVFDPQKALGYFNMWQLILGKAKIQLQTDLRKQERILNLPPETQFMQSQIQRPEIDNTN